MTRPPRGMRATNGAIERIDLGPGGRVVGHQVVGGGKPLGICGSGLIHILAAMMEAELISPNGKFRDEFLNREVLDTLLEARVLTAWWRREYNEVRPHSSLGYRPPAPETICLLAAAG